jgi:hypothetical protein
MNKKITQTLHAYVDWSTGSFADRIGGLQRYNRLRGSLNRDDQEFVDNFLDTMYILEDGFYRMIGDY